MLDHLQRQHHVEARTFARQFLGRRKAVLNWQVLSPGMTFRYPDQFLRRVDPEYAGPEPCHCFADEPAAAADIDYRHARERPFGQRIKPEMMRGGTADPVDPHRIQPMKWTEIAVRVPPGASDLC